MNEVSTQPKARRFTRRRFLLGTVALVGGGLGLRWALQPKDTLATGPDVLEPSAFLQITPDGEFIFQLDKVEMGQGTMTGLATLIGEELDVDPARLDVRWAPVMRTFQRPQQTTGGSDSIAKSWDLMRETGATARAMLVQAAADQWQVPAEQLETNDGVIINPANGEALEYADVAAAAAELSPPWSVPLKDPAEFRWIGTDIPRLDALAKVTGEAGFGIDVQRDGMLTAVIARIPEMRAELSGYNADLANAMPGVRGVVPLTDGVAVVAEDFWTASQAARQIELSWDPGPTAALSDSSVLEAQRNVLDSMQADIEAESEVIRAATDKVVQGDYSTAYLAHAPMEPLSATVHVRADRCDIWTATQSPDGARELACLAAGMKREQIHVHNNYLGGGFGRRFINDYVAEAVTIAKEFDVPVKLVWPREADIQRGYFRQQTVHRMSGAVDTDGNISHWRHLEVAGALAEAMSGELMASFLPDEISAESRAAFGNWMGEFMANTGGAFQASDGTKDSLYTVAQHEFELQTYNTPVVISIWRSVGASYTGFVVESFVDELAHAAAADPMLFRLERLKDKRHLTVLQRLNEESGWGNVPADRYQGVALFESFNTVVGQVAEVSVLDNAIRVHKVTCVVDCGRAVNPDIVRSQMQSGVIFGLTAALYGEINFTAGQVQQSNFHDYRMLRMATAPDIEVHIIDSDNFPSGVGEPGTPPIGAAVANAVYAATGKRLRSLPLKL